MKCDKCMTDGTGPTNYCAYIGYEVELKVCYFCSINTAKGQWPVMPSLGCTRWPWWADAIEAKRWDVAGGENDAGVGDTVARIIGPPKSEAFKKWYAAIFWGTCGCERRQAEWNLMYPYKKK